MVDLRGGPRAWWSRHGLNISLTAIVLGGALILRQTHAAALSEVYRLITLPWQPEVDPDLVLRSAATQELKAQVKELEYQNRELKKLLSFTDQFPGDPVPAPVIGRGLDHWWQQLTLGRGSNQGVAVGNIVVAPGGLVGRIEQVSPNTSRVLLISDATSRVGVMLSRSRQMGLLRGEGSQKATLEFFDKNPKVAPGDNVFTSGLSSLYPAGILVGKVRSIDLNASPAPKATVELTAPLGLLEWGLIYSYAQTSPPSP